MKRVGNDRRVLRLQTGTNSGVDSVTNRAGVCEPVQIISYTVDGSAFQFVHKKSAQPFAAKEFLHLGKMVVADHVAQRLIDIATVIVFSAQCRGHLMEVFRTQPRRERPDLLALCGVQHVQIDRKIVDLQATGINLSCEPRFPGAFPPNAPLARQ